MKADAFRPDAALLPLLPAEERARFEPAAEPDPFADHIYFQAEQSSKGWAVYHNPKPERLEGGSTRYGLRVPILTAFERLASPEAVTIRVADILNRHWHEGDRP